MLAGELRYVILEPARELHILSVDEPGVVEPTVLHQVAPMGSVRFYVQFYA